MWRPWAVRLSHKAISQPLAPSNQYTPSESCLGLVALYALVPFQTVIFSKPRLQLGLCLHVAQECNGRVRSRLMDCAVGLGAGGETQVDALAGVGAVPDWLTSPRCAPRDRAGPSARPPRNYAATPRAARAAPTPALATSLKEVQHRALHRSRRVCGVPACVGAPLQRRGVQPEVTSHESVDKC